ncbi:MAG: ArsR family transcriptional regulator [Microthrixaceae bacterium]|nr:ArsR family transcriptional regulator [Microthrixaceae bacterium]
MYANEVAMPEPCCTPLTTPGLDEADATELSGLFKVLADPARLRLLSLVANAPGGEACACDLVEPLDRSQPTVSTSPVAVGGGGSADTREARPMGLVPAGPQRLAGIRAVLEPVAR